MNVEFSTVSMPELTMAPPLLPEFCMKAHCDTVTVPPLLSAGAPFARMRLFNAALLTDAVAENRTLLLPLIVMRLLSV